MKSILAAVLWACLIVGARAQTFADVAITHVRSYVSDSTGVIAVLRDFDTDLHWRLSKDGQVADAIFESFSGLQVGQTVWTEYDYTMSVSIRGLPYPPTDDYCEPIIDGDCFNPNGHELSFARIIAGSVDSRNADPFLNYDPDEVSLLLNGDTPQQFSQSGTLRAGISTSSEDQTSGDFAVLVFMAVFASPIPEPSSAGLMLIGIALLAGVLRVKASSAHRSGPA